MRHMMFATVELPDPEHKGNPMSYNEVDVQ